MSMVPRAALELAVDQLRKVAIACAGCGGTGVAPALYLVFLLDDDPRIREHRTRSEQARAAARGPCVEKFARTAATSDCGKCREVRQVIKTAKDFL